MRFGAALIMQQRFFQLSQNIIGDVDIPTLPLESMEGNISLDSQYTDAFLFLR